MGFFQVAFGGAISYTPWIRNATLRQNVLFGYNVSFSLSFIIRTNMISFFVFHLGCCVLVVFSFWERFCKVIRPSMLASIATANLRYNDALCEPLLSKVEVVG
jgi:hypothetical protein